MSYTSVSCSLMYSVLRHYGVSDGTLQCRRMLRRVFWRWRPRFALLSVVGLKRTWDQKLSSGLMSLSFITTHIFQFHYADTEYYRHASWLNTLTFFRAVNKHVPLVSVCKVLGRKPRPAKLTFTSGRKRSMVMWRNCTFLLSVRRSSSSPLATVHRWSSMRQSSIDLGSSAKVKTYVFPDSSTFTSLQERSPARLCEVLTVLAQRHAGVTLLSRWDAFLRVNSDVIVLNFYAKEHAVHVRARLKATVIELYCPLDCVVTGSPTLEESSLRQNCDDPKTDQIKGVDSNLPGWQPKETAS